MLDEQEAKFNGEVVSTLHLCACCVKYGYAHLIPFIKGGFNDKCTDDRSSGTDGRLRTPSSDDSETTPNLPFEDIPKFDP